MAGTPGLGSPRIAVVAAPPPPAPELNLSTGQWGMIAFLVSEAALFSTLIVVYLAFVGKDTVGPFPREALSLPLVIGTTICLLSSSVTIHRAEARFRIGDDPGFRTWWLATIALGLTFLAGTGYEWYELITRHKLTMDRNLFGSTFYTLVGFHGLHVTAGLVTMLVVLALGVDRWTSKSGERVVELVSWYWHFVDGVWVVVFSVVYLYGR
ncbi:MAG: heme-copper oxidase subunit III [Isosphaeraceae bacterium]|nr:heme-copper oxidase subunit III [Isosphaeraceae bacterium]